MNKTTLKAAVILSTALFAHGASAASATGTANARILSTIAINETTQMSFGSFSASSTSGTITTGGVALGGVTKISNGNPGVFNVTGSPNTNYALLTPQTITLNGSNGGTMTAAVTLPITISGGGPYLDSTGTSTVTIHATLGVAANQLAGAYTGLYTVSVHY